MGTNIDPWSSDKGAKCGHKQGSLELGATVHGTDTHTPKRKRKKVYGVVAKVYGTDKPT